VSNRVCDHPRSFKPAVHVEVEGRKHEQGEQRRRDEASDHHDGEWTLDLRTVQPQHEQREQAQRGANFTTIRCLLVGRAIKTTEEFIRTVDKMDSQSYLSNEMTYFFLPPEELNATAARTRLLRASSGRASPL